MKETEINYFIKNLKYLTKNEIKQSELARILNISRQSVSDLINSKDPKASTLIKISNIYNIPIDNLLKIDLENKNNVNKQLNFGKNLKALRKQNNLSQIELANLLGINLEKVRRFEQSKQKGIDFVVLERITKVLNCTYDELFK